MHQKTGSAKQNTLGAAWSDLPTGDRAENIGNAIDCFNAALEVFTAEALPECHGIAARNLERAQGELREEESKAGGGGD